MGSCFSASSSSVSSSTPERKTNALGESAADDFSSPLAPPMFAPSTTTTASLSSAAPCMTHDHRNDSTAASESVGCPSTSSCAGTTSSSFLSPSSQQLQYPHQQSATMPGRMDRISSANVGVGEGSSSGGDSDLESPEKNSAPSDAAASSASSSTPAKIPSIRCVKFEESRKDSMMLEFDDDEAAKRASCISFSAIAQFDVSRESAAARERLENLLRKISSSSEVIDAEEILQMDNIARIYDSLTSHTAGEAKRFAQKMKDEVPRLKAVSIEEIDSPQQEDGSNDCGLWVIRNAYKYVLTKEGCAPGPDFDYSTLFSRDWLKQHLPATPEATDKPEYIQELAVTIRRIAAERVGKQTAGDAKCASCGQGFGKTGKPAECTVCGGRWHLTCLASGARPRPGMDDWKCNPCAKSLARVDDVECPFVYVKSQQVCGAPIAKGCGAKCVRCEKVFCGKHRHKDEPNWRCPPCAKVKPKTVVKCASPNCTTQNGYVNWQHAVQCSKCERCFHNAHVQRTQGVPFVCSFCTEKAKGRNFVEANFSDSLPDATAAQAPQVMTVTSIAEIPDRIAAAATHPPAPSTSPTKAPPQSVPPAKPPAAPKAVPIKKSPVPPPAAATPAKS
eukprot:PhM_4_TR11712/c3_g2_i7/m.29570